MQGIFGWQDYAVADAGKPGAVTKVPPGVPIPLAMSALGMTGLTAYFGLLDVGRPKAGETVVVSGAAGATGSVVGQIAKIKGCRAIGIAGGADKCAWVVREARVRRLHRLQVGERRRPGSASSAPRASTSTSTTWAATSSTPRWRAWRCAGAWCCAAPSPSTTPRERRPGPKNYLNLLIKRGRMEGFIVLDYLPRAAEAVEGARRLGDGRASSRIASTCRRGWRTRPEALRRLFRGENVGKQLVKIA